MSHSDSLKEELLQLSLVKLKQKCKSLKLSPKGNKSGCIASIIEKMNETSNPETLPMVDVNCTSITSVPSYSTKSRRQYKPIPELVSQLQEWIEELMDKKFQSDFWRELKKGTILCEVLNKIQPGICYKFEASDRVYIQRRNVEIYLSGCRALGVHKNNCFKTDDLVKNYNLKSSQRQIVNNLHAVFKIAKQTPHTRNETQQFDISLLNEDTFGDYDDSKDTFDPSYDLATFTPTNTSSISLSKKKKRKFKLVDDSTSISFSVGTPSSMVSSPASKTNHLKDLLHRFIENEQLSNDSYMDRKCYTEKELLIFGYFREHDTLYKNKNTFIKDIVSLFCIGDVGSVNWSLSGEDIDDLLDEEEDMPQKHKQLVLGNGNIVIDVDILHNNNIISFTLATMNKIKFIAYVYCKCINNGCIVKRVYNTMIGDNDIMDIDLMDITIWQKENALKFQEMFELLNANARQSAQYFRIPNFNEKLKFMVYAEILNVCSNVNISKQIEYKWNNVNKIQIEKQCGFFADVEVYSDNFGHDSIEYDKCWTICLKYSDVYKQFGFVLKLLKLPMKIVGIKIVCILSVDGEQYNKTTEMDLIKNRCEWDIFRIDPQSVNQKKINVSIGIIEAFDKQLNVIQKSDWKAYGIV